jgi:ligand-binding SRPBCC domain-containing protein
MIAAQAMLEVDWIFNLCTQLDELNVAAYVPFSKLAGDCLMIRTVRYEQWLPLSIEEVFPFFTNAYNLEKITPPWLNFSVLRMSTDQIKTGTEIDYRLRLHGIPLKWKTLIETWEANKSFVDTQIKGPFKLWHHTHDFVEKDGGTLMIDTVRYELPMGVLGDWTGGWMVRRDVKGIFDYRKTIIEQIFPKK